MQAPRLRASLVAPADRAYWMAQSALLRQARDASDREALELARQAIPPLEAAQFRTGLSVALVAAAIGTWLVEELLGA